jgi:hypothetical protein
MTTAPPEPVYSVMVSAPLLVVKVNWACTTAGNAESSTAHSRQTRIRVHLTFMALSNLGFTLFSLDYSAFKINPELR